MGQMKNRWINLENALDGILLEYSPFDVAQMLALLCEEHPKNTIAGDWQQRMTKQAGPVIYFEHNRCWRRRFRLCAAFFSESIRPRIRRS